MTTPLMLPPSRSEVSGVCFSSVNRTDPENRRYAFRDLLRQVFPSYVKDHPVSFYEQKVMNAIMACGTGELGYTVSVCPECGVAQIRGDTCGNRNCPSCGLTRQLKWRAQREAEHIYGIPYYHVVFTLPHALTDLIIQNQRPLLNLLFHAASRSMLDLCLDKHDMIPGIVMVLHTCGGNMLPHYHIHMLVSGGGLTADKLSFIRLREGEFFLPAKLLAKRYKNLFMSSLRQLHEDNKISFDGYARKYRNSYEWNSLMNKCWARDWNVEIKPYAAVQNPAAQGNDPNKPSNISGAFADYALERTAGSGRILEASNVSAAPSLPPEQGIDAVHQYMSEYTNRTAITDDRILSCSDSVVTIECKVHHRGGKTTKEPLTLTLEEFVRRFLLNILPPGFIKTRFAGILAGCVKSRNLALIRELLEQETPPNPTKEMTAAEVVCFFYRKDYSQCPTCRVPMRVLGHRMRRQWIEAQIRAS